MNKIDKDMKTTLKRRMVVTIHLIYIMFTNFEYYYEITNTSSNLSKFDQRMNCLHECHNGIQPQQCLYINQETQIRCGGGYGGCIQCHLHEERLIFKQHMFDMINHGYFHSFDVPQYIITFSIHVFYHFGKLQMSFNAVIKINTQNLQTSLNARH